MNFVERRVGKTKNDSLFPKSRNIKASQNKPSTAKGFSKIVAALTITDDVGIFVKGKTFAQMRI